MMQTLPVPLELPAANPPASLEEALAGLRASPREEQQAVYERLVFPFAARAARNRAELTPRARLLVVPVGTQPYSPILAALSCKAEHVALLVTEPQDGAGGEAGIGSEGSRPTGARVRATLCGAGLPESALEVFSIGDGTRGDRIVDAVGAAVFFAGDPWSTEVTVDISGGRKSTTAVLGGIASALGYRLSYVEGRHVMSGFYADERRHDLANVAAMLDLDRRYAARQLLRAGAWAAAATELHAVLSTTLAPPATRLLFRFAQVMASAPTGREHEALRALAGELVAELGPDWREATDLLGSVSPETPPAVDRLLDLLDRQGTWR